MSDNSHQLHLNVFSETCKKSITYLFETTQQKVAIFIIFQNEISAKVLELSGH